MNKLELVDHIAAETELTKVAAAAALEGVGFQETAPWRTSAALERRGQNEQA